MQKKKNWISNKNTIFYIFSILLSRVKPALQNLPDVDVCVISAPTVLLLRESFNLMTGWMGFETKLIISKISYNLWLINQDKNMLSFTSRWEYCPRESKKQQGYVINDTYTRKPTIYSCSYY